MKQATGDYKMLLKPDQPYRTDKKNAFLTLQTNILQYL